MEFEGLDLDGCLRRGRLRLSAKRRTLLGAVALVLGYSQQCGCEYADMRGVRMKLIIKGGYAGMVQARVKALKTESMCYILIS